MSLRLPPVVRVHLYAVAILVCTLSSHSPLLAGEPFMVPRSNRVIKGDLIFPDGVKFKVAIRDGSWVTVENRKDRYYFGFAGIISPKTARPNFLVYSLLRTSPEDTAATQIALPQDIPIGKTIRYPIARNIMLSIKGVEVWNFANAPIDDPSQYTELELKKLYGEGSLDALCCLPCDDRTVCASSVSNSCGSCSGGGGGALVY
jgi:hypothetical protein